MGEDTSWLPVTREMLVERDGRGREAVLAMLKRFEEETARRSEGPKCGRGQVNAVPLNSEAGKGHHRMGKFMEEFPSGEKPDLEEGDEKAAWRMSALGPKIV